MTAARHAGTDAAVLIVSCDKYADVWPPMLELLRRHWPDCPYPIYLGANHQTVTDPRVRSILIGDDPGWAAGVREMLRRVDSEYIILLLEDFFLTAPVDTVRIQELAALARDRGVGSLLLRAHEPPFRMPGAPVKDAPGLTRIAARHPYRVTTQAAIWRKEVLERLLLPGFSAWDFELIGSWYSRKFDEEFWEVSDAPISYEHVIEKGRWRPVGLSICRHAGVEVLSARGQFTEAEMAEHVRAARTGVEWYWRYEHTMGLFLDGRRWKGAVAALAHWWFAPQRGKMLAVLLFGLLGTRALLWLESLGFQRKLRRAAGRSEVVIQHDQPTHREPLPIAHR